MDCITVFGLVIFIQLFIFTEANNKCSVTQKIPKYHLIEKCHRSTLGVAARANYESLTSCFRLGIEKKALALNFSPKHAWNSSLEYSCEVLKCAESEGGLSLSNDTRYDYYSIYAKPIPNVNTTCVPASGMFYLLDNQLNYTQAQNKCKNMSGVLADVTSEQRTDALAQVLINANLAAAYVGLTKNNGSSFHSLNETTSFNEHHENDDAAKITSSMFNFL
ncbi:unnamed protein product [Colias eurytheme]|nr:unnamed protein product [Colias eurytheme]